MYCSYIQNIVISHKIAICKRNRGHLVYYAQEAAVTLLKDSVERVKSGVDSVSVAAVAQFVDDIDGHFALSFHLRY